MQLKYHQLAFQLDISVKEIANEIEGTNTGAMIGYVALFLSLFSIAFYPVTLGSLAILVGLLAVNFGARTLGYTAIGFGSFFCFIYFTLSACFVSFLKKHTKLYLVCSFVIQHNMTASTTMFRCNFLKHWIIFFIPMLNKHLFKTVHIWRIRPILFCTCV